MRDREIQGDEATAFDRVSGINPSSHVNLVSACRFHVKMATAASVEMNRTLMAGMKQSQRQWGEKKGKCRGQENIFYIPARSETSEVPF